MEKQNQLVKVQDLYSDLVTAKKEDQLAVLLNQPVKKEWVKEHPFVKGHMYLPIDKVEFLLKKVFKTNYKIEVLKTGMLLNAVEVTVRVHVKNVVTGEWQFHDGVAACEVQTAKGTGSLKLDMSNINKGAITMALPIAKSLAIKDACDHLGTLFGSDLNRKDTLQIAPDEQLFKEENLETVKELFAKADEALLLSPDEHEQITAIIDNEKVRMYQKVIDNLTAKLQGYDN